LIKLVHLNTSLNVNKYLSARTGNSQEGSIVLINKNTSSLLIFLLEIKVRLK
jgi:hypothetical protein